MEGADDLDIQRGGNLQNVLDLLAVLAHDADVVTAGLIVPVFVYIQSAELAEAVSREQNLVVRIVGHHNLGPVDHGCKSEGQSVLAQGQGAEVFHRQSVLHGEVGEELADHSKGFYIGHHGHFRVSIHKGFHRSGMVRLHVLDHQIVGLTACQSLADVLQPLSGLAGIDGVHNSHLFVQNHIRIIGHAIGHHILALKQIHLVVVGTYIQNGIGNFFQHNVFLLLTVPAAPFLWVYHNRFSFICQ